MSNNNTNSDAPSGIGIRPRICAGNFSIQIAFNAARAMQRLRAARNTYATNTNAVAVVGRVSNKPAHIGDDTHLNVANEGHSLFADVNKFTTQSFVMAARGPGLCKEMAFTPDGNQILYIANRGMPPDDLTAYTVATWTKAWNLQLEGSSASMAVSPDGRFVVVAGDLKRKPEEIHDQALFKPGVSIINLNQRKIIKTIDSGDGEGPVAWSPDGKHLGLADVNTQIFDAESGQRLTQTTWENSAHVNICFTPNGRYLIVTDMNGRGTGQGAQIWDGQHLKLLQQVHGNINSLSVTRDSKYLALSDTGRTTIWQLK